MPQRIYNYIIDTVHPKTWFSFCVIFGSTTFIEELDMWVKVCGGLAAIVVSVFAVISYVTKIRLNNQDRKLKKLEYEERMQEFWDELEKRKRNEIKS